MWYRVVMPPYEAVPCREATVQAVDEEAALFLAYAATTPSRPSHAGLREWDEPLIEPATDDMVMAALGMPRLPGLG